MKEEYIFKNILQIRYSLSLLTYLDHSIMRLSTLILVTLLVGYAMAAGKENIKCWACDDTEESISVKCNSSVRMTCGDGVCLFLPKAL